MRIAVIGTGNVGAALGRSWAKAGHDIVWGSRRPGADHEVGPVAALERVAEGADVIVLAVPFDGVSEVLASLGDLDGRAIVDATNALGRTPPDWSASGAEYIAQLVPGANVVKAFNTMGWETMADPSIEGRRAVCFYCGDDPSARTIVSELATDLGFEAVDAGNLAAAALLESLAALWVHLAFRTGMGRDFAFALLHRSY